jgi:uncharacterized protein
MATQPLNEDERRVLLNLARETIERVTQGKSLPEIILEDYSPNLREHGASFVTLTESGELRGCIGALEAYQPLVQDVCEHAAAAALEDYRFQPVRAKEVTDIHIEISRLTPAQSFTYKDPQDLLTGLRPGIDGVILRDGNRRATFLPQVWEQLPDAEDFLTHLCKKMGSPGNLWKHQVLSVFTYQVEEFHELEQNKTL